MVLENLPSTRASRSRRQRALWPAVTILMALIGAFGGVMLATH